MASKILIVESPNKIKKLKGFLGADWEVKASVGHVANLATKQGVEGLGLVDLEKFKLIYEVSKEKRKVVSDLKRAIVGKQVYLAMDPDREGEAIASTLQLFLNLKNDYKRVTFTEITEKKVKEAIASPGLIDGDMVRAATTRRAMDRIYGFKGSWVLRDYDSTLKSVGRVQSAGLKIVVDREKEITNFSEIQFGEPEIIIDGNIYKLASLSKREKSEIDWTNIKWPDEVKISSASKSEVKVAAPKPLTTNSALRIGVTLGLSASQTTKELQDIFSEGLCTYPRTDNPNMSKEAIEEIVLMLTEEGVKVQSPVRIHKAPSGSQEGHEAIRPSHVNADYSTLKPTATKLYEVIVKRAIASVSADGIDIEQSSTVNINGYVFENTSREVKELNWRGTSVLVDDSELKASPTKGFTTIIEGARKIKVNMVTKKIKAPGRYTEASFLSKLEKEGIGRPSTYASMLSVIQARKYVTVSKKKLVPTTEGYKVIAFLEEHFPSFVELGFTKRMESSLDKISKGEDDIKVLKEFYRVFDKDYQTTRNKLQAVKNKANESFLQEQKKKHGTCPLCSSVMVERKGKYGKFISCSGFPKCKHTSK